MKVLMRLRALPNKLLERLKLAARTRPILAIRNGSRRRIRNEPNIRARLIAMHTTPLTNHLLHTNMTQERDEVAHLPRARPVDVISGELLRSVGRRVEKTKCGSDKRRDFSVRETEEETLFIRPAVTRRIMLFDMRKELRLRLQPRKTEVRTQRVQRTDHVRVLQIPRVFIRHPLRVCEQRADGAAIALDGGFVAAQHLEADDVARSQFERRVGGEAVGDGRAVEVDDFLLLLRPGFLREVLAGFVGDEGFHAAVCVFCYADDVDVGGLGEGFDEVGGGVVGSALFVGEDAGCVGHEVVVALQEVLAYCFRVHGAGGCQFLQSIFQDWGLPLLHEGQWAGPSIAVCLELPQERLDVFFIFVVVGVDSAVADDVRCGRDIAADGRFVLETKACMELA